MRSSILALLSSLLLSGCLGSAADHGGTAGGTGNGNGSGNGNGTGNGSGSNCGVQNFVLNRGGTPDLLLVQDISGSMGQTESDGDPATTGQPSKWTQVRAAITNVVTQVSTVDWGLMMFPEGGGASCVPATPDVPVGANSASSITTTLTATMPNGNTPTAAAMNRAVSYLNGLNDGHAKYILLATDGEPNSCGSSQDDSAGAVAAVTAAANAGVNTFVVGIGTAAGAQTTLNNMAIAGKQTNPGAPTAYYPVTSQSALETVLGTITGQIVSCSYALQSVPANPDQVQIEGDGMTIPHDPTHMNGWDFGPGNQSIVFYGAACTALQNGSTKSIGAVYGCPPIS